MGGDKKQRLFAPSGILTPPGRVLGETFAGYTGSGSITSLKFYGRTVFSGPVSESDPPDLRNLGYDGSGQAALKFRVHAKAVLGPNDLISALQSKAGASFLGATSSAFAYAMAQGTNLSLIGEGEMNFKPKTPYTFLAQVDVASPQEGNVQQIDLAFVYSDGTYDTITTSRMSGTHFIVEFVSDPEKTLTGIRAVCETGRQVTFRKPTFSLCEGELTYETRASYAGSDSTITIAGGLNGFAGERCFVSDIYDGVLGKVTRRIRNAVYDELFEVGEGVYAIYLDERAALAPRCAVSNLFPFVSDCDAVEYGETTGFSISEDGLRILIRPQNDPGADDLEDLLRTRGQILYSLYDPVTETASRATLPHYAYTAVTCKNRVPPHRMELIHS